MTDNVTVSNLPPYQQYTVRSTGTSSGQLQHVRLDIGSGTSESQVSGSLPVSSTAYSVRYDEGATYTYIGEALPGTLEAASTWRIKRLTIADNTILWADGDSSFDNQWSGRAGLSYS